MEAACSNKKIQCLILMLFLPIVRNVLHRYVIGRLHMTSHTWREKKGLTKSCNLCWRGMGQTPTFGVILKSIKKLIKNWNELLLVCYSKTNKLN